jgi:UDP-GlcNAc:undecaprenyl-phosphate GlcNAc-1-phosphate transferase
VFDYPSERSLHDAPIPRGGGLSPALAALGIMAILPDGPPSARLGLIVAAGGFAIFGLFEDVRGLPTSTRFVAQLVVSLLATPLLVSNFSSSWRPLLIIVAVVWLISYVNAFNFMDGINGISVAQVVVAGMAWYVIGKVRDNDLFSSAGIVVTAVALGFAPYNLPVARLFLGDVGSYFFGAWLGAMAIVGVGAGLTLESVLAPLSLYLGDTGSTLLRRFRQGKSWYLPHREHVFQRLVASGWSHMRTARLVMGLITLSSALGGLSLVGSIPIRLIADFGIVLTVAGYLAMPRLLFRARTLN